MFFWLCQQLATQLEGEATVTDAVARTEIQSAAMQNGIMMQNLGALLLELGRTTMTLRMGESSVCFGSPCWQCVDSVYFLSLRMKIILVYFTIYCRLKQ